MQMFIAMDYLTLMLEKYLHFRKRQKHAGVSPRKFLPGGFVKSWSPYPGKNSDFSEGATKPK